MECLWAGCGTICDSIFTLNMHLCCHATSPFTCKWKDCTYKPRGLPDLYHHIRCHMESIFTATPMATGPKSPDDMYKCPMFQCTYATTRTDCLKKHVRVHTNEKPFQCTACPYMAKEKRHLTVHMRLHTDAQPYKCTVDGCLYFARQLQLLQNHMRRHEEQQIDQRRMEQLQTRQHLISKQIEYCTAQTIAVEALMKLFTT